MLVKLKHQQHKRCSYCNVSLNIDKFCQDKSRSDGLNHRCRDCSKIHNKIYPPKKRTKEQSQANYIRNKSKIMKRVVHKSDQYKKHWREWFLFYYPNPFCQVCNIVLEWQSEINNKRPRFDHRHGGNETIKCSPSDWIGSRPCNDINKIIWLECDFGILCASCNTLLPTKNRLEWLHKAMEYAEKSNEIEK